MASPDLLSVFDLYRKLVHAQLLDYLDKQAKGRLRRGIYTVQVVLWLMIVQRLQANGTLASSVEGLTIGLCGGLLPDCKRVREGRISLATGGYCQARQKMPRELVKAVSEELVERLREQLHEPIAGLARPILLLDGSSLRLEHCPELLNSYPPAQNQRGASHWPVLRIVVLHDVATGLAQPPSWGAMFGQQAVSEQALAEQSIGRLSHPAVVMGDRNFGIFSVIYRAQQAGHQVLMRLTEVRARKLRGGRPVRGGEYEVEWKPSRWDMPKGPLWSATSVVRGRLIVQRIVHGKKKIWLYLFTDLPLSSPEIVALYGRRWHVETDLRWLKQTIRLQHLTAKSLDMMEKELLVAVSAYNLVRAVMVLAARRANLQPRQLSFTAVLNLVDAAWPKLVAAKSTKQHTMELERMLDYAAQCKLPQRRKRRVYPRASWPRGYRFATRATEKTK